MINDATLITVSLSLITIIVTIIFALHKLNQNETKQVKDAVDKIEIRLDIAADKAEQRVREETKMVEERNTESLHLLKEQMRVEMDLKLKAEKGK